MRNLHLFSLLLSYPTEDLQSVCGEIKARLADDPSLPGDTVKRLGPLLSRLATSDIYAAQEAYVDLFDRGRTHSLHLFEHVHGESRDRGQAMVDLRERYLAAGLSRRATSCLTFCHCSSDYCSTPPDIAACEAWPNPAWSW
ncbi:MAG: nitrate reductase molybdenum cofactor assembly chaperone [Sphingomonadales bacterium]|nr:nitrate reductase molybdenum cofactor assembly chaperone [Sphingomonadales bacterium]